MGPDWSSALINVPYNIYLYNGDIEILRLNYEPIKRNCDFMESMTVDYTLNYGTGDWCAPFEGPAISKNMGAYKCPVEVSDTGFFYHAAMTVVKLARLFGKPDDEAYYLALAGKIKAAFREKFFDKETYTVKGDCQTATAVMLYFNLCEEDEREPLLRRLIEQIGEKDWHLDFGVLGCKFVMHTLGAMGEGNVGHRMLAQRTFPGCQRVDRPWRHDPLGVLERRRLTQPSYVFRSVVFLIQICRGYFSGRKGAGVPPHHSAACRGLRHGERLCLS